MNETLTIPRKKQKLNSFKHVPLNAFFLGGDNSLYQKVGPLEYNMIADSNGNLFANQLDYDDEDEYFVKEILDIKKITFS